MAPLGTAFQFGADEGYELIKGFQVALGHKLYTEIWNDQPPLHTGVLALVFKIFGVSLWTARLTALAFSAVLLWAFYRLVEDRSGHLAAWAAALLLIGSRDFLELSVSVMLEPAMLAMGLLSVLALFRYVRSPISIRDAWAAHRWLLISGFFMGLALQTKLTAAIFIPAMMFEIARSEFEKMAVRGNCPQASDGPAVAGPFPFQSALFGLVKSVALWWAMAAVGFGVVWCFFPGESFELLLGSHFSAETRAAFDEGPVFDNEQLLRDWDWVALAGLGSLAVLARRRWDLLFPLVLLATVFAVHHFNRPFWTYYWLHFSVPLAWLGAIALREWFDLLWKCEWPEIKRWPFKPVWALVFWAFAASLWLTGLPQRLRWEWASVANARTMEDDATVRALRDLRSGVQWLYADRPIYAFHARLPIPPELAVMPRKRFASGQIDDETILEIVKRYQPEIILLNQSKADPAWKEYLERDYQLQDGNTGRPFYLWIGNREALTPTIR